MEYTIVYGYVLTNPKWVQSGPSKNLPLSTEVNEMMQRGWRPQGGITLMYKIGQILERETLAMQAMVRDLNDPHVTLDLLKASQ